MHTTQDSEFARLLVDEDYEVMPNRREAQEPEGLDIDLSTLTTGWKSFTANDSIAIKHSWPFKAGANTSEAVEKVQILRFWKNRPL